MSNRLAHESSPYLLQHAHNPVDWYPWCQDAIQRALDEQQPIFLSIGYAACHWCHVMERESFEDPAIAQLLNNAFVCIKVDREERPDLDQIYMTAVQMMTGHGGWPMSVFLTPELRPFYGGTYWPPAARMGMPGFADVLHAVVDAWQHRREQAEQQAEALTSRIREFAIPSDPEQPGPSVDTLLSAARTLERSFDFTYGGFGQAPKFPHAMDLEVLLRVWHRTNRPVYLDMVRLNLDQMARGGIYDHLGGGFARYSVDERWLVPHFEKMLYDNALLTNIYLQAYTATHDETYAQTARETLDFILRDMTDECGGFHSTLDADSEGVEGKYYVWTPAEIRDVLGGAQAERFCRVYDVTEAGNFEGHNILHLAKTIEQCATLLDCDAEELRQELSASRQQLLAARAARVPPGKDDKILVSWNALMIDALARGGGVLGEARYLDAARRAVRFLLQSLRRDDGRLLHSWRQGRPRFDAYLDDYAYLANALVTLYEFTFEEHWIDEAVQLVAILTRHFADREGGGFYFTADDHEPLIARQKDNLDSSVPSGNGMAATVLARLGYLCGRTDFISQARDTIDQARGVLQRSPTAAGQLLVALDLLSDATQEIVILGPVEEHDTRDTIDDLYRQFIPNKVVAWREESDRPDGSPRVDPIFIGRRPGVPSPTVFVCRGFTCGAPVYGRHAARQLWEKMARPGDS